MKIAILVLILGVIFGFMALKYHKPVYSTYFCPDGNSLNEGFVYTNPAGQFDLEFPYRKLEGPFIAREKLSGRSISYAGLFTHKYWDNGKLIQFEEPISDMSGLLKFEVGTQHEIQTVRYNPQEPQRKWNITSRYDIKNSEKLEFGWCSYSTLNIDISHTITYPDGKIKTNNEKIKYIPELMLMTFSNAPPRINITKIRKKKSSEGKWPFTSDAHSWLERQ